MTPTGLARLRLDEGCTLVAIPDPLSPLAEVCRTRKLRPELFRQVRSWQTIKATPWTVGCGCTGAEIGPDTTWTQARADAELLKRVQQTETVLQHALSWFARLAGVRQDVLTNISFNVGVAGLLHWPVTLKAVELGRFAAAGEDILGNTKWRGEVHGRDDRCAAAMTLGRWA